MIEAAEQVGFAIGGVGDAGVVAGGDEVRADGFGVAGELAEFQVFVAADAGVGGAAAIIFADEVVDDAAEIVLEVEGVKGDIQQSGDVAGVGGVGGGAAALVVLFDLLFLAGGGLGLQVGFVGGFFFRRAGDQVDFFVGHVGGVVAEAHENADAVVALALEERSGDG